MSWKKFSKVMTASLTSLKTSMKGKNRSRIIEKAYNKGQLTESEFAGLKKGAESPKPSADIH